jgi:hypothetical protein
MNSIDAAIVVAAREEMAPFGLCLCGSVVDEHRVCDACLDAAHDEAWDEDLIRWESERELLDSLYEIESLEGISFH